MTFYLVDEILEDIDSNIEFGWPDTLAWAKDDSRAKAQIERSERLQRYVEQLSIPTSAAATQVAFEDDSTDDALAQNDSTDDALARDDLKRTYSIDTVVSTTSEFAHAQMVAQARTSEDPDFRVIGEGSCGIVFAQEGRSIVFKVAKHDPAQLHNDHRMHLRVSAAFDAHPVPGITIPQVRQFVEETETEFFPTKSKLVLRARSARCTIPTTVIVSDHILPLPERIRETLIEKYCDERVKDEARSNPHNKDCLARVYLGKPDTTTSNEHRDPANSRPRFFTLRNFPMYYARLLDMRFDCDKIAQCMGRALAVLHWEAGVDGRDVEFVLGSSSVKDPEYHFATAENQEDFYHRSIQLWMLDFNLVQEISRDSAGVDQAVHAWRTNDPYFPRPKKTSSPQWPSSPHFLVFMRSYLRASSEILRNERAHVRFLPFIFIHRIYWNQETDPFPVILPELWELLHRKAIDDRPDPLGWLTS
ncbi:hypothetical protein BGZ57DRAFT_775359 [Hyaloscypha finlandica]|nr:hypothetical protein BGZ57DRAFT_775359 [Hyaloscypha finlandica]